MRILLEPGFEIFACFVEATKMPVRKPHKRIRGGGGIEFNQRFELVDGLFGFARHEITFAERRAKIGPPGGDLQTGLEQGDGVFKIILRHADARQQKDDVGIFRRQFVGAHQQVQCVNGFFLLGINLRQQVQRFWRIGFELQRAIENELRLIVVAIVKISFAKIIQNLEFVGLQGVCFFQFQSPRPVLFAGQEQHAQREMNLSVTFVLRRQLGRRLQRLGDSTGLQIDAHAFDAGRSVGHCFGRWPGCRLAGRGLPGSEWRRHQRHQGQGEKATHSPPTVGRSEFLPNGDALRRRASHPRVFSEFPAPKAQFSISRAC